MELVVLDLVEVTVPVLVKVAELDVVDDVTVVSLKVDVVLVLVADVVLSVDVVALKLVVDVVVYIMAHLGHQ